MSVNRVPVPARLAGVKAGCVHLCRGAGNTVWSHNGKRHSVDVSLPSSVTSVDCKYLSFIQKSSQNPFISAGPRHIIRKSAPLNLVLVPRIILWRYINLLTYLLTDDKEIVCRACVINELVIVRDGVCNLLSDEFVKDDVNTYLTVGWFHFILSFCLYIVPFILCVAKAH